jgi:hypothetical protein
MTQTRIKAPAGLAQFLPAVPKTAPLAPAQRPTQHRATRVKLQASSTPAPAKKVAAPQEPVMGETQESRRAKTLRLGQARMVNLLRAFRLVRNMSSRNYDWTPEDIDRMEQAALSALNDTFSAFRKGARKQKLEELFQLHQ